MMIGTILLVANIISLIVNDVTLFSFWHFLWIYPLEIIFYIVAYVFIIILIASLSAMVDVITG